MGQRSAELCFVVALVLLLTSDEVFAVITLSAVPKSRNVSAGTLVEFTCATAESGVTLAITATPTVVGSVPNQTDLSNGGNKFMLSFSAPPQHSSITIACIAFRGSDILQPTALLMIQGLLSGVGNLTSSEVDHCTLHFTWAAPYTLQGVPINYYTIDITRHSDGAVLRSDTTNTTEYLYTVLSLGETLEVVVAAVNGAGTGNVSKITFVTPSSSIRGINITTNRSDDVRNNNNWSYVFDITEISICGNVVINKNSISSVTVEACNSSSCVNTSDVVLLSSTDGVRRVMATFTNLEENSKYNASVHVQYNGGVVQQSQPVEISTSDLMNFTFDSVAKKKCLNVTAIYVTGHVVDSSIALFKHTMNEGLSSVRETVRKWNCIKSLTTNESYNVLGIDSDSPVADINTSPAVYLTGVYVPIFSLDLLSTLTPTSTPSELSVPTVAKPSLQTQWIWIILIVLVIILFVLVFVVIVTIIVCAKLKKKQRVAGKIPPETEEKNETYDGAEMSNSNSLQETKIELEDQTCNQQQETQYACIEHKEKVFNTLEADTNVEYGTIATTLPEKECVDHLHSMQTLELTHSTVYGLLRPLSHQWDDLGKELGLSPQLSKIKSMFDDNKQRLSEVLRIWEHSPIRSYSWNTLATALESKKVSQPMLAGEIRKAQRGTKL